MQRYAPPCLPTEPCTDRGSEHVKLGRWTPEVTLLQLLKTIAKSVWAATVLLQMQGSAEHVKSCKHESKYNISQHQPEQPGVLKKPSSDTAVCQRLSTGEGAYFEPLRIARSCTGNCRNRFLLSFAWNSANGFSFASYACTSIIDEADEVCTYMSACRSA